uniref:COMM domain-containing protein n=1 Tax=Romanomermis culicivorax TaxID=13658 RepID=A0A915L6E8_ROMCU
MNRDELQNQLSKIMIANTLSAEIIDLYVEKLIDLQVFFHSNISTFLPTYANMEWRFEVEIAKRSLREVPCSPMIKLFFEFVDENGQAISKANTSLKLLNSIYVKKGTNASTSLET